MSILGARPARPSPVSARAASGSALTMLGIIIGVASVVALVSVGQGASSGITSQINSLGTNLLTINAGSTFSGGVRSAAGSATTLTLQDADAVKALTGVAAVSPELSSAKYVVAGDKNTTTTILGTTAGLPDGPRLHDLAGELPDRHRRRAGAARRRPRLHDGRRPRASTQSSDRQPRSPSAASRSRSSASSRPRAAPARPERRRPDPDPGEHAQALLHRDVVLGRALDRRQRRDRRPDGDRQGGHHRAARAAPRTSRPGAPPTSRSRTRPSCCRPATSVYSLLTVLLVGVASISAASSAASGS